MTVETRIYCRSGGDVPQAELAALGEATITREADSVCAERVAEILRILELSRPTKGRDRLRELLEGVVQLVVVRREAPSPDPSPVEAAIASALAGVIEAPESGRSNRFFDAKLRRFYRL